MTDSNLNARLFADASKLLPGGVSSPVRAFAAVDGVPRFISSAKGASFVDAEGTEYLDFVQSWGPLILGHAHPEIIDEVKTVANRGLSFGAPHIGELRLAQRMVASYPGIEQIRFVSSGTEATMSAIRLARAATGRNQILKFSGCYHGHSDCLLVEAGSGAVTFGQPSSAGVPKEISKLTSVLPLGDIDRVRSYIEAEGQDLAAVIIEPIPANNGLLLQSQAYLQELRYITKQHGVILIFDEVISGFRVAPGGAAQLFDITPDLATFGKVIGGGMAVGALAGPREIMSLLAPKGPVYQAGTLSGNPLAMAAGAKTLEIMTRDSVWESLEKLGSQLEAGVLEFQDKCAQPFCLIRQGSIFWFCLGSSEAPKCAEDIPDGAAERYRKMHSICMQRGIYLAPSSYEVGFLSTAHSPEDIDRFLEVLAQCLPVAMS